MTLDGIILRLSGLIGRDRAARLFCNVAARSRRRAMWAHRQQFNIQWSDAARAPEWFDHFVDQYYRWPATKQAFWLERGICSSLAIKPGARVAEICCGDGFNAAHFYSAAAKSIIGVDFDPHAITHAKKYNSATNIEYVVKDVRTGIPTGPFDNIVWDAAIEHFTQDEIDSLIKSFKAQLMPNGILSGYTITEKGETEKHLVHHEYEFRDMSDLRRFFTPYFRNVRVFETICESRHNLYFWASDGSVPFDEDWSALDSASQDDPDGLPASAVPSRS